MSPILPPQLTNQCNSDEPEPEGGTLSNPIRISAPENAHGAKRSSLEYDFRGLFPDIAYWNRLST